MNEVAFDGGGVAVKTVSGYLFEELLLLLYVIKMVLT
jgi:hypothetical protein